MNLDSLHLSFHCNYHGSFNVYCVKEIGWNSSSNFACKLECIASFSMEIIWSLSLQLWS